MKKTIITLLFLVSISVSITKIDANNDTNALYAVAQGDSALFIAIITILGTSTLITATTLFLLMRRHNVVKRQKEALRESEQRFKILHNASFGGIALHDKGYILECNQGLSDITGYAMEELVGMNGLQLIAPEYRDFVMKKIKSGYEKPYEAFGLQKNGEIFPLKLEAKNIPYNGKTVRAVEFRDLSEIKKQEAKQRASEQKYRLLHDTMIQGVIYQDTKGIITACNPAAEKILDLSLEQMKEKSLMDSRWQLIDEEGNSIPKVDEPSMVALRNREKVGPVIQGMQHPKRKETIWLSVVAIPLFKEMDETPYQVYATFEDITEKRNAKIKLQKEKDKLKTILDNLPIGIAVNTISPSVKFEYINDNFLEIYGVKRETLEQNENFFEIIYEDKVQRETLKKRVAKDISSKDPNRMVWKDIPIKRDGEVIKYINAYATPLPDSRLFISSVIDVTDRKQKEEEIIYVSHHDYLTDIANRRYYQEQLAKYDNESYYPLGIIIMDMNDLKLINDAFGHSAGNDALKRTVKTLIEMKREKDFVARIGGDEFALICPNTEAEEIETLVESIDKKISSEKIRDIDLSLALGYAVKKTAETPIRNILTKAENNMYKNKVFNGHSRRTDAILSILQTLQNKFVEEKVHSERVSHLCKLMGEAMNLRKDEISELEMAGLFHDIGKISIPDAVLYKPEKLTKKEWKVMEDHTVNGYQILRAADRYSNIAEYAMSHHERIDGKGYPNGIKGDDIHLFSKIISVADAYEAMTSDRPYRQAMKKEDAIKELTKHKNTQFDAKIVDVFVNNVLTALTLEESVAKTH